MYSTYADQFSAVLAAVPAQAWQAPTPCAGWTVTDVVDHVVDSERSFLAQHGMKAPDRPASDGGTPIERWRALSEQAKSWLATPGVAERNYDSYFGPTTLGATMDDFYGWDLIIHTWDVARGAGLDYEFDDADRLLQIAQGWGEAIRSDGICGPEVAVPPDAPAADRLVAYLGRDPQWAPPAS